jgi:hypothetical protein
MAQELMAELLSFWLRELSRGRKRGPEVRPALAVYSAIAWAAWKCSAMVRRLSPFSWRRIVATSPSWWKSDTRWSEAVLSSELYVNEPAV